MIPSRRSPLAAAVAAAAALCLAFVLFAPGLSPALAEEDFRMTPEAALQYIERTPNLFVVDVRTPQEYGEKHLPMAVNIPVEILAEKLDELPQGRPVLLHCRTGIRAERAYNLIREKRPEVGPVHIVKGQVSELLK